MNSQSSAEDAENIYSNTPPRPEARRDAGDAGSAEAATAAEAPEAAPEQQALPEFPQEHRQALSGLLFLGRLEEEFSWLGHRFVVKTLTTGEHTRVGLLTKPYLGTRSEVRAHRAAIIAAGCVSVDGKPLTVPLGMGQDPLEQLRERMAITLDWYPPTVDHIHSRIMGLEVTCQTVVDAMGKA